MTLFGGPADGADVEAPLQPAGGTYLVKLSRPDGVKDVLVYRFADRTTKEGRWVLSFERWAGFLGMPPKGEVKG